MGKNRIAKKAGGSIDKGKAARALSRNARKNVGTGRLYVQSTYNNTRLLLTDKSGGALAWASSGALGFKGAKKGTPFAAAKAAEVLAEKAEMMGVREVDVIVKGIGPGRESSIRAFTSRGIAPVVIRDETPIPHNGPRPKKPRRV